MLKIPPKALTILRFASEVAGKFPKRDDTWPEVIAKSLAVVDSAQRHFRGRSSAYAELIAAHSLRERTSQAFVSLFFGTSMAGRFQMSRFSIDEHTEMIEAVAPTGERLLFQEHRYGRPEVADTFFYSPRFDFADAVDALWLGYPNGIYMSVQPKESGWGRETTFVSVSTQPVPAFSKTAEERVMAYARRHCGRRCYLAHGPPGTGKTQFAMALARELGGRVLKIDASALSHVTVHDMSFLLSALRPRFIVVDDFDRAPIQDAWARVLYMLEHLKAEDYGTSMVLTVNDPTALDEAALRSGRIDDAVEFNLPSLEEREDILMRLGHGGEGIAERTDGYSHADLNGLVERLERESLSSALEAIWQLRHLASMAKKSGGTGASPPSK